MESESDQSACHYPPFSWPILVLVRIPQATQTRNMSVGIAGQHSKHTDLYGEKKDQFYFGAWATPEK